MTIDASLDVARNLGVATLAGLAVGIEREWSGHAAGPAARFAGARTFLLLGLIGGLAGWLRQYDWAIAAILLGGGVALTVGAYVVAARRGGGAGDVDGTTEVAALAVLGLGAASGLGFPLLTSAAVSVMVLALAQKTRIHALIARIGERELTAALQFAVLALVILPLLPDGPYGPFGSVRPRTVWTVVLLFSAINFAGYIARRAVGETRGYGLTGLLGGIVSSTAVALSFSQRSRQETGLARALALGVVAACTVVFARVLLVSAVLNAAVAWALLPYFAFPLALGAAFLALGLRRLPHGADQPPAPTPKNPLGLWSAVQMALAFQLVLIAIAVVRQLWGTPGVLTSAVVIGLTDMDALTFSMARLGHDPAYVSLAARAIAIGAIANTLFKLGLTIGVGRSNFRRLASAGLAALAGATALALVFAW